MKKKMLEYSNRSVRSMLVLLFALLATTGLQAQLTTNSLILEDGGTGGANNSTTVATADDAALTTSYTMHLPNTDNLGVGSMLFVGSTSGVSNYTNWLGAGTNGQVLVMQGGLPSWTNAPGGLPPGTTTNSTLVFDGTNWIENTNVTMNPTNGNTTIGGDLTVIGPNVTLPNGSISNTELENSSLTINSGTGLSGGGTVALGGTITLVNEGVTKVTGTTNQVNVTPTTGTGDVVLSLPQDIDAGASPTFTGMTLTGLVADNSQNDILVQDASGNIYKRAASTLGGGSGWSLTGNAGTTAGTNFLGTTDTEPLEFKVNSQRVMRITRGDASGDLAPNITGGYKGNLIPATGTDGNFIGGGGAQNVENKMTDYADFSSIVGGALNLIGRSADYAVILGGYANEIDEEGDYSVIAGGQLHYAYDRHSFIGSGYNNKVGVNNTNYTDGAYASVVGGYQNTASGYKSFVGGGLTNLASGDRASVVGGQANKATGQESFVAGGEKNEATAEDASVVGGYDNTASGKYAFIGGGKENQATKENATIGGGLKNLASGKFSTIPGGCELTASGEWSAALGGTANKVSGTYSGIFAGRGLELTGNRSIGFLAGNTGSNNMKVTANDVVAFGNADLWLANNDDDAAAIRFYEAEDGTGNFPSSTHYSSIEAQDQSTNIRYLLPDTAGSVGQTLKVKSVSTSGGVTTMKLEWDDDETD